MTQYRAVSLFSNCGAGDIGYKRAGFHFEIVSDVDPRRLEVAVLNHPGAVDVPGDLRDTWPLVVSNYRKRVGREAPALLAACPPCQGISSINSDRGRADDPDAGSKDKRNLLVVVIANVALELQPNVIVVENVPAFLSRKVRHPDSNEPVSAAALLVSTLKKEYAAFPILTDLADYGVPQTRKRTFITFVRRDLYGLSDLLNENRAPYPRPTHVVEYGGNGPVRLREALRSFSLPSLDAGSRKTAASQTNGGLHSVPVWEDRRYPMVATIPAGSGGSAWDNEVCERCGRVKVGKDDATCPRCGSPLLRPVFCEHGGTYRLVRGFRSSSYKRMSPDLPAATITTASGHVGSSYTIHPFENRLLSPLECALLQTFPDDFKWGNALEKWGHTNVRRMIGEAVPPLFTYLHGKVLKSLLTAEWTIAPISLNDERCVNAQRKLVPPTLGVSLDRRKTPIERDRLIIGCQKASQNT